MSLEIQQQVLLGWTVAALFLAVLMIHRTALLGFTLFAAFTIATSSHSALLWASLTGIEPYWITPAHIQVYKYCGTGLILFAIGVFVAWKPLRDNAPLDPSGEKDPLSGKLAPSWLTPQFVLLCMCIGAAGYILTPITRIVPTVHAIWSIFFDWLVVGILIAGFYSAQTRRYKVLFISLCAFFPLSLIRVVGDGHAGALGLFLVQFVLVVLLARKVRLWQVAALGLFLLFLGPVAATWFKVRGFIRSGSIQGNTVQRVMTFIDIFKIYYEPFNLDKHQMVDILRMRIDMTDLLAEQVNHQPTFQPYRWGATVTDNLLITLVPRILWPDKPVKVGGSAFITKYTGHVFDDVTSVNTPVQLEFYANFGPVWTTLLLGLYGYFCARLELAVFRKDFRDLPKLLRAFVYMFVVCRTGSQLTLTLMRFIPGMVGIWMAGRVIEIIRRTLQVHQDFLTPLPVKKKKARVVVVGEEHGQNKAAQVGQTAFRRRQATLPLHASAAQPYGFRKWDGRPGRAPL